MDLNYAASGIKPLNLVGNHDYLTWLGNN